MYAPAFIATSFLSRGAISFPERKKQGTRPDGASPDVSFQTVNRSRNLRRSRWSLCGKENDRDSPSAVPVILVATLYDWP